MKILYILFAFAICMLTSSVYSDTSPEELLDLGKNVYVSSVTYDPPIFFTDDVGTVTFEVTNGNFDQGVTVNHASFGDNDIKLTSNTYDSSSLIGAGKSRNFTFSVIATNVDGIYYPQFSVSFYGANGIWGKEPVKIDNTPLIILVTSKPDVFTAGRKETISIQVSNPRENEVKNVMLYVSGENTETSPSTIFIGKIGSGESVTTDVSITPLQYTDLEVAVEYKNGDNSHWESITLPVEVNEEDLPDEIDTITPTETPTEIDTSTSIETDITLNKTIIQKSGDVIPVVFILSIIAVCCLLFFRGRLT